MSTEKAALGADANGATDALSWRASAAKNTSFQRPHILRGVGLGDAAMNRPVTSVGKPSHGT